MATRASSSMEIDELAWSVGEALRSRFQKVAGRELSGKEEAQMREVFCKVYEETEHQEKVVRLCEKQIGRAIVFGGAAGLLRLFREHLLSPAEKAEILAKGVVACVFWKERYYLREDERNILERVMGYAILKKEAEIRSRIGEEVGIAV